MDILFSFIAGFILMGVIAGVLLYRSVRRYNTLSGQQQMWIAEKATLQTQLTTAQETITSVKEQAQKEDEQRKQAFQTELQLARETMKTQFEKEMQERTQTLKQANAEQMAQVVEPLRRELDMLRQLVHQSKESSDKNTASLAQSIKDIFEHDKERDKTTQTLADALKNRGKVQGDWGSRSWQTSYEIAD